MGKLRSRCVFTLLSGGVIGRLSGAVPYLVFVLFVFVGRVKKILLIVISMNFSPIP
jgi:hypothetical protein